MAGNTLQGFGSTKKNCDSLATGGGISRIWLHKKMNMGLVTAEDVEHVVVRALELVHQPCHGHGRLHLGSFRLRRVTFKRVNRGPIRSSNRVPIRLGRNRVPIR